MTGIAATLAATVVAAPFCVYPWTVSGDPQRAPGRAWEDTQFLPKSEAAKLPAKELEGVDVPGGEMTLLFGAFRVPLTRTRGEAVHFVEVWLTGGVADTAGVFLALIWTAGFLPTFLDPLTATVLFAKPVPRWAVLVGKVFGVLLFVAGMALMFVAAVWLRSASARRSGIPVYSRRCQSSSFISAVFTRFRRYLPS